MLSLRTFLPTWINADRAVHGTLRELRTKLTKTYIYPHGALPSFLIIGAQRSGTTSLYNYLLDHPMIAPAAMKEVHFFDVHFHKGVGWYRQQFRWGGRSAKQGMITGEASPYYFFHPLAPQRIAEVLPDVKLILLLRNPVDRAFSHYHHIVRSGHEKLSFADALAAESERLAGEEERIFTDAKYRSTAHQWYSYRSRGCYMDQLERWLKFFPRENMLTLFSERFYRSPADSLHQVCGFLGLPPLPERASSFPVHNLGNNAAMDREVRDELEKFYRSHNQRLAEYLADNPAWDTGSDVGVGLH